MTTANKYRRLTLMFQSGDYARADIALTNDRIYYRFATDDTIEDGELPWGKCDFYTVSNALLTEMPAREGESPIGIESTVKVFIDNRIDNIDFSSDSTGRATDILEQVAEEFNFLRIFCSGCPRF